MQQRILIVAVFICISVAFVSPLHYSYAQTSTSTPSSDTSVLIKQLQALIISLQTQINELRAKLAVQEKELAVVKSEIQFTKSLFRGSEGDEVKQLQEVLSKDPEIYPERLVTGFFGPATEAAVKRFQEKYGIESIGTIGPKTRRKLNELITKGAGESGKTPPGLLFAPGLQQKIGTSSPSSLSPFTLAPLPIASGTIPAIPAQPIGLTETTTVSAVVAGSTTIPVALTSPAPSSSPSSLPSRYKWSFYAGTNMISSPAIGSDGTIYVMDGKLFAITPTGSQKWAFSTESNMGYSSPAISSDGTIYINTQGPHKVYAINPDGTKKWEFFTSESDTICCAPSIGSDGTIYVTQISSGKLYALNPDGTRKWVFSADPGVSLYDSTIGVEGVIYIRASNKLYAINPNGTKKWGVDVILTSAPAMGADNTIYVQGGNTLYAFNPDGTRKWTFIPDGKLFVSDNPVIGSDGTIYARTSVCSYSNSLNSCTENLYAVNPDGTKKWLFSSISSSYLGASSGSSPAVDANGIIYIGSGGNTFYAINPDGTKKWDFQTNNLIDSVRSSPALASDGTVYFSTWWGGYLYALSGESAGLANAPWPKFKSNNKNTGMVTSVILSSTLTPSSVSGPILPPSPSPTPASSPSPSTTSTSGTASTTIISGPDTIVPPTPVALPISISGNCTTISWSVTDNVGVTEYKLYKNSVWMTGASNYTVPFYKVAVSNCDATASPGYNIVYSDLYPGTSYSLEVYDAAGNKSASSTITISSSTSSPSPSPSPSPTATTTTTTSTDTTAPSSPANLTATPVYNWHVTLTWSQSTDNVGVVGYSVYRNGTQLFSAATSSSLSVLTYRDWNVIASTAYSYTVAAYDAAGNVSTQSSAVSVTPVAETIAASPSPSPSPSSTPNSKPAVVSYEYPDGTWCYNTNTYYHPTVKGYCQDNTGTYDDNCSSSTVVSNYSCGVFGLYSSTGAPIGNTTRCVRDGWTCSGSLGNTCSNGACITATTMSEVITPRKQVAAHLDTRIKNLATISQILNAIKEQLLKLLQ